MIQQFIQQADDGDKWLIGGLKQTNDQFITLG